LLNLDLDGWDLPHNIDAERAVIGGILLDPELLHRVESILSADDFHTPGHAMIFGAMQDLDSEDEPIDFVTLSSRLKTKDELHKVGGIVYLTQLAGGVPTAANTEYYGREVKKSSLQRLGVKMGKEMIQMAMSGADPKQIAAMMDQSAAIMLDETADKKDFKSMYDVMKETYETIEKHALNPSSGGITGLKTGYQDLDKMTKGLQRQDLIIVAARPSVGKTAFALNIAQHAGVDEKKYVAIFSLEMSANQLGQRALSSEGHIESSRIRTGQLQFDDWDNLTTSLGSLSQSQIYVDDTPGISVSEIRAKCRRLKKKLGHLDLILIDYLQLITLRGRKKENRQQEVSEISRVLKQIARELDVPVVALSQLSRAVEQRQDKRPMMSDLRESGSIEQDADIVAFLYRDDYYDKESEKKNIIEIIIGKQRNGPTGTVELGFLKEFSKFVGLDKTHHEAEVQASAV